MQASVSHYLLVMSSVAALVTGQLLFKSVALRTTGIAGIVSDWRVMLVFAGALALYFLSTVAWITALRHIPLYRAYSFVALGFILIPVASYLIFKEPLTMRTFWGGLLIGAGILLTNS